MDTKDTKEANWSYLCVLRVLCVDSGPLQRNEPALNLPRLCVICDADVCARAGWRPIDLAQAFIAGGATFLQLRAKAMPSGALLETAEAIPALAHQAGATLIVNDRADPPRLSGAAGVHAGPGALAPAAARRVLCAGRIRGLA